MLNLINSNKLVLTQFDKEGKRKVVKFVYDRSIVDVSGLIVSAR